MSSVDEPQIVTADELYRIWMKPDAVEIINDTDRHLRIVVLDDGTAYAASTADVRAQLARYGRRASA